MTEYIERDVVLSHKWKVRSYDPSDPDPVTEVVSVSSIMQIPAADVVEVRYGWWITRHKWDYFVCSCCSHETNNATNYCPKCGAKMDGGQGE